MKKLLAHHIAKVRAVSVHHIHVCDTAQQLQGIAQLCIDIESILIAYNYTNTSLPLLGLVTVMPYISLLYDMFLSLVTIGLALMLM